MMRYRLLFRRCCFGGLCLSWRPPWQQPWAYVRGTVVLPEELKAGRRFLGHWRVENTTVPVQAAPARGDTVVVLLGPKTQVLAPEHAGRDRRHASQSQHSGRR